MCGECLKGSVRRDAGAPRGDHSKVAQAVKDGWLSKGLDLIILPDHSAPGLKQRVSQKPAQQDQMVQAHCERIVIWSHSDLYRKT